MYKEGFDVYDELPEDMVVYLRYNGRHFNRKLVEFATSKMTTRDSNGTEVALEPITREQLDNMMKQSNVHLTNNDNPYDAVFVANMCKADYLGSSVPDGLHLCLYNRGTRVPLFASSRFIKKSEASLSQGGFLRFVRSVDH